MKISGVSESVRKRHEDWQRTLGFFGLLSDRVCTTVLQLALLLI